MRKIKDLDVWVSIAAETNSEFLCDLLAIFLAFALKLKFEF